MLEDKEGNIVKDPETGEARRIDFTVSKDGEVVKSIEVTSETARQLTLSKLQKKTGLEMQAGTLLKIDLYTVVELVEIPKDTKTEVRRYA